MTAEKGRIFISYRRADSAGYAGRIYDRLSAHFGKEAIFRDVAGITPGANFIKVLEDEVQSCDALIALIGKRWLNIKGETGQRRLENPNDFVRIEIATALKRSIRVIPVLLDNTPMPQLKELPDELQPLANRQAAFVDDHSFDNNVQYLIKALEVALEDASESRTIKKKQIQIKRLLKEVDADIEIKEWKRAQKNIKRILELDPKCTQAQDKLRDVEDALKGQRLKILSWLKTTFTKTIGLTQKRIRNFSLLANNRLENFFTKLRDIRIPKKVLGMLAVSAMIFLFAWLAINKTGGETVYFISTRTGNSEIYKLDDKGNVTQMTTSPSVSRIWDATIASNGNLYFTSNRSGKSEIYRLDSEGKVTQITFSPNDSISWEPTTAINGKLFFTSNRSGKNEIYSVDENGEIVQMTDSPGTSTSKNPEVSLSGKLYFTSDRSGKNEIYSIDENGKIVQMTDSPSTSTSEGPSLSLSGKLYFVSNRSGKTEIYSLDENKKVVQMTFSPSTSASKNPIPSISGRLYFTSDRSGRDEVYYLDESGEIVQITFNSGSMLADVR